MPITTSPSDVGTKGIHAEGDSHRQDNETIDLGELVVVGETVEGQGMSVGVHPFMPTPQPPSCALTQE